MPANILPPFAAELFKPVTAPDSAAYTRRSFFDIIEGYEHSFDVVTGEADGKLSREFAVGQTAVALTRKSGNDGIRRTMFLAGQSEVPGMTEPVSGSIYLIASDGPRQSLHTFVRYGFRLPPKVAETLYGTEEIDVSQELSSRTVPTAAEKQAFHMAGKFLELSAADAA